MIIRTLTFVAFAAIVFLVIVTLWWFYDANPGSGNTVICTQEAKQCPDGSYVGRTGPRCAFAPCPRR